MAIDDVTIQGAQALNGGDVADKLATAPTEKFLGLFRGVVYDYAVYDPSVLQRDMARVERYYRGKGFLEAHARVGRVIQVSASHVRIEILVEEGPPTRNRSVRIEGLQALPIATVTAARKAVDADVPGEARFDEASYASAKDDLKRALTDNGYAYAKVEADASVDLASRRIDYVFTATPGPACTFGPITIVGLDPDKEGPQPQEIEEAPLRRAINIDEGEPFSTADIDGATQALLDLEVFSAVRVEPDLPQPPPDHPVIDLKVSVEPTRLRQVRLGGGVEFDAIKTDIHLRAGWEDHNFLGGLRDFSIDFQPGIVPYPLRIGVLNASQYYPLPEERLKLQFRQPSFLEARTSFFLKPEFNVYPFLVQAGLPPETPVVGYIELRGSVGLERPFSKLSVSLAYNAQVEFPFYYNTGVPQPERPPEILLAYPELVTKLDLRDDATHPHEGIYLANDLQVANAIFGSRANDVRTQPEVRAYFPIGRRVTLAMRGAGGVLFPENYQVASYLQGNLNLADPNRTLYIEETYFRGFSSGGPSTNRGYPIHGIAPYGYVPFLLPATYSSEFQGNCVQQGKTDLLPTCTVPIAGMTLWELSIEARIEVSGPLSVAVFCDSGDVTDSPLTFRPDHPHVSCGVGGRYDTPVGPIRLDIGYRVHGLQVLGITDERNIAAKDPENGTVPQLFNGVPLAIAFGIGEAY